MSQFEFFLTLAPISAAVVVTVAVYSWLQGRSPLSRNLTYYLVMVAGFLFGAIGELGATSAENMEMYVRVQYLFMPIIPVFWLRLALLYTGQVQWASPRRVWIFALLPAVTTILAWSNTAHHLVWDEHSWVQVGQFGYFSVERYGAWFWTNGIYFYTLLLAGALLMVLEVLRSPKIYRYQTFSMITGALLPLVMNLAYVFHLFPGLVIDYTPLAFAFAGLAFVLGILRHRLLSISPVGRAALIESMLDPMIVLDEAQNVIDLNPAAQRFLGIAPEESLGRPFSLVWPAAANIAMPTPDATRPLGWTNAQHMARRIPPIITTPDPSQPGDGLQSQATGAHPATGARSYELHVSPLHSTSFLSRVGKISGWLVVLHDLTMRRQAEEALQQANEALAGLYSEVAEKSEALEQSNNALTQANTALTEANVALHRLNEELEERVAARTESLRQRAAELEVLTRVSDVLRQSDTLDVLLNLLINETTDALSYGAGAVMLAEDDNLRVTAVRNLPPGLVSLEHPVNSEPIRRAMKSGSIVHTASIQLLPNHAQALAGLPKQMTGSVVVPMKSAGRSLGVLIFFFDAGHTPTQEWPLSAIAEMGANAIQRVRMMDTLEQLVHDRTRDISTLYDVTTTTNEYQDFDTILARILEKALGILHGQVGLVHLFIEQPDPRYTLSGHQREPQTALRLVTSLGMEDGQAGSLVDEPGPWSWVFERGSILVIPDVFEPLAGPEKALAGENEGKPATVGTEGLSEDAPSGGLPGEKEARQLSPAFLDNLRSHSACTYVGVPIHAKGRTLGVMSVFGVSLATFSAEDIALLAAIADHLGGAVENALLRQKAEQAAVVEERQRLARDLHDSVTQSLYSLVLFSSAGREALDPQFLLENDEPPAVNESPSVERARKMLQRLAEVSQQALKELRLLIFELRPLALQKEGLVSALRSRLETVEQRAGMRAVLLADHAGSLSPEIESGLYGIAQEALNNTLKHSQANQVTVRFEVWPEHVELEISDNGCGFQTDPANNSVGFGLSSMRERAAALGGELSVRSEVGRGTSILVNLKRNGSAG